MRYVTLLAVCLATSATHVVSTPALAHPTVGGTVIARGGIGTGIDLAQDLDTGTLVTLTGQAEYLFTKSVGAVVGLDMGFGTANARRLHLGGRYTFDLGVPFAPYAQAEFTVGRLKNVLGADLTVLGARVGGGGEYFFTKSLLAGLYVGADLSTTRVDRSHFYGTFDMLAYVGFAFSLFGNTNASVDEDAYEDDEYEDYDGEDGEADEEAEEEEYGADPYEYYSDDEGDEEEDSEE